MRIAVVDTETTGVEHETCRVVELAAIAESETGFRVSHFLLDPRVPIPPEAMAVHHITNEMVVGRPQIEEVVPGMLDHLGYPEVWVAHNASFDRGFLPMLEGQWLCTWRCSMHLWPEAPGHSNQVLRYWLKLDPTFPDVPQHLLSPHRALYDCAVTLALLERMLEQRSVEELVALSTQPVILETVRFGKYRGTKWRDVPRDYLQWVRRQTDMDPDVMHTVRSILQS